MKRQIGRYFSILITYLVVDFGYQVSIGLKLMRTYFQNAGVEPLYASSDPSLAHPYGMVFAISWMFLMSFALLVFVVNPAIEKRSVSQAIRLAMLLGATAYSTLGFFSVVMITGYPVTASFAILFEGLVFPPIAAGLVTKLVLRKQHR